MLMHKCTTAVSVRAPQRYMINNIILTKQEQCMGFLILTSVQSSITTV